LTDQVDPPSGRERQTLWLAGGVAAATLILAAGGYFAVRHFAREPAAPPAPRPVAASAPAATPELDADALTPFNVKSLTFEEALAYNRGIPVSTLPNPAAKPFVFGKGDVLDRNNAADCLTAALYYEARTEPVDGQKAVAQVVLNRVRHPAYPKTVCGVVFQGSERLSGCQFSFTCDGALAVAPDPKQWEKLKLLAIAALDGAVYAPAGMSTHYHAGYVVPYWAESLVKAREIGLHIFYRWTGGWGLPSAFTGVRTGVEVLPLALQTYSTTYLEALAAAEAAGLAAAAQTEIVIAGPPPPLTLETSGEGPPRPGAPGTTASAAQTTAGAAPGPAAAPAPAPQEPAQKQWFGGQRRPGPRLPTPGN
jgi:hypothetical protein